jgi:nitrile hydratase accessory protein
MQSRFEHFAVTSMMNSSDRPPRADGAIKFSHSWERIAFGVALALSRDGRFEWEDFRQHLIAAIGDWERHNESDDPSWNYYDQWLSALEATVIAAGLASRDEITARVTAAQAAHLCGK